MLYLIFQMTGQDINIRGSGGQGRQICFIVNWDALPIKATLWNFMYFEHHVRFPRVQRLAGTILWVRSWEPDYKFLFSYCLQPSLAIFSKQLSMEAKHLMGFEKYLTGLKKTSWEFWDFLKLENVNFDVLKRGIDVYYLSSIHTVNFIVTDIIELYLCGFSSI